MVCRKYEEYHIQSCEIEYICKLKTESMKEKVIKFNIKDQPEFFRELRKRVNTYFKENNISKQANTKMVIKSIAILLMYIAPFVLLLTNLVTSFWGNMGLWAMMGLGMAGVGFSIMHDANHGSYSKNQTINDALGFLIHFVGGFKENWKIQHNVLHHSFTNIEGYDEDIKFSMMRFSPTQERKWIHRFQIIYAPFLYGFMTIYWMTSKDFQQLIEYNKKGLLQTQQTTFNSAILRLIFHKLWYFALTIAAPFYFIDLPWWQILIGFFTMHYIAGMTLSLVFQSAHVLEETDFFVPDENGSVENNWAIHQMKTTSNFAKNNLPLTWFVGGLNFQVEHHLFPNICHIHYSKISEIVKKTAGEFNVPYHEHKTFTAALRSHFSMLNKLGTGQV